MSTPNFTLYTAATPNGHKVSIALEIVQVPYKFHFISFTQGEQREEWFLKLNPNGRIPVLVDHTNGDFAIFESGAILLYLAEHYDPEYKLLPKDPKLRSKAIQWLMFQMGGVGPMFGQATHFFRYAKERIPYPTKRYQDETKRLLSVLEAQLQDKEYLVGNQITLAEISLFPWVRASDWAGVKSSSYVKLEAWLKRLEYNVYFQKGLDVPEKNTLKDILKDQQKQLEKANEISSWVLKE